MGCSNLMNALCAIRLRKLWITFCLAAASVDKCGSFGCLSCSCRMWSSLRKKGCCIGGSGAASWCLKRCGGASTSWSSWLAGCFGRKGMLEPLVHRRRSRPSFLRPCCLKRGLGSRPVALSLVFCWPGCRVSPSCFLLVACSSLPRLVGWSVLLGHVLVTGCYCCVSGL